MRGNVLRKIVPGIRPLLVDRVGVSVLGLQLADRRALLMKMQSDMVRSTRLPRKPAASLMPKPHAGGRVTKNERMTASRPPACPAKTHFQPGPLPYCWATPSAFRGQRATCTGRNGYAGRGGLFYHETFSLSQAGSADGSIRPQNLRGRRSGHGRRGPADEPVHVDCGSTVPRMRQTRATRATSRRSTVNSMPAPRSSAPATSRRTTVLWSRSG